MIYAIEHDNSLVVAAATSFEEYNQFIQDNQIFNPVEADLLQMMTDKFYSRFTAPPTIFDLADKESFIQNKNITILQLEELIEKHETMFEFLSEGIIEEDNRTIEEIFNLNVYDKWDRRTEEQKQEDEENKKKYNEAKKKGGLTEGSWGDGIKKQKEETLHVTDIRISRDVNGKASIDNILAVKGLHKDTDKEIEEGIAIAKTRNNEKSIADKQGNGLIIPQPSEIHQNDDDADNEDLTIEPNSIIAIFFKVEVIGAKLSDIRPILLAENIDLSNATVQRNNAQGCWFAVHRKSHAEKAVEVLQKNGFVVSEFGVNDMGEMLAPKGISVVDVKSIDNGLPRPWNENADVYNNLSEEEKNENRKKWKAREFYFCSGGYSIEKGCFAYFVPKKWFDEHECLFPESLNIEHLLPHDLKEIEPGLYNTKSRNRDSLITDLQRKFTENLMLNMYVNLLR